MKRFCYYIVLGITAILIYDCSGISSDVSDEKCAGIYGRITDYDTGNAVKNANVQLRPSGETTLTGSDGEYEFRNLASGDYSITVSKAEYTELIDNFVIRVNSKMERRDLRIEKLPASILVVDNNSNPLNALDFGEEASSMQFTIFNNGPVSVNCSIQYSCPWISSISAPSNPLKSGKSCSIIVSINRDLLNAGENSTIIVVATNNGNNQIKVSAIGKTIIPEVTTLPMTNADGSTGPWCDYFHGKVTVLGNPPYYKRGFCFSSQNKTPTIADNPIEVPGTGIGEFSCYSSYFWNHPYKINYYVRAWLKYGEDKIVYGNVITFTYNDV